MENDSSEKPIKKLFRSDTDRIFAGVCGGLGEYFGVDAIIFRILFIVFAFSGGAGIILYIILALVLPSGNQKTPVLGQGKVENLVQEMGERTQKLAEEMRGNNWFSEKRNIIGLIIVVFGVLILFDRLSPVHWLRWEVIWPAVIIFLGVLILTTKRRN
jgi:phage shock protein C